MTGNIGLNSWQSLQKIIFLTEDISDKENVTVFFVL